MNKTKGCLIANFATVPLNLPDGQKTTIEGEWRHMSDANRLSERITMLQHAIYEQYEEYRADIPVSWSR
ncbi:hypothetical protein [Klebsiella pneumoniae]|uniref:hypothetical protein n=1 Tax=Klebsiella pneumoniae TaxID=573 RepID=UPI000B9E3AF4|nr:hypothetical protein [Klebsiella pneumoniae]OZJ61401.1 hypothetical protein CEO95_27500 [Klebsiella pneumoniae]OZJ68148.1 hypothetical protein CEO94_21075 [Klebsiella pneumoniae]OZK55224.1 hypothetical protein CEO78_27750 [Klebsiella pneumoniae]